MHHLIRGRMWLRLLGLGVGPALSACEFPTDDSAAVFVTLESRDQAVPAGAVLLRGDRVVITARAWRRVGDADSIEVPNAAFLWQSSDPTFATVSPVESRSAEVIGIRARETPVAIEAVAAGFESARPGTLGLRIAELLEVDSVRPRRLRFGEQLTVHGVGIGGILFSTLGNATLLADTASLQGDRARLGSMRFWVPPPASSGQIFAVGPGIFVAAADSTLIDPFDLYEPNDSTPWLLRLDRASPRASAPALKIFNPALAFEDLHRDTVGYDWYRFTNATPNAAYTIVVDPPGQGGGNLTFLASPNNASGPPRAFQWAIGPGVHACKGVAFAPKSSPADQLIFALKRLPPPAVDLVSEFVIEGAYALLVVQGYLTVSAKIGPDRFEENDLCDFADQNFGDAPLHIDLGQAFADTLTIDNPYDVDWFRLRVPGATAQPLTVRVGTSTGVVPAPVGTDVDQPDLGLFLFTAPAPVLVAAAQTRFANNEGLTVPVPPGDYYVVVIDQGGAATRYGLCMELGASCAVPVVQPVLGGTGGIDLHRWAERRAP